MEITALDLPSTVEALDSRQAELPIGVETTELCKGLIQWHNPINRFCVLRLHRSADPLKRTQEYVDRIKSTMSTSDFMREYELFWESLEGKPVYGDDFSGEYHKAKSPLGWNPKLVVCRGWDFGLYPACVFAQLLPFSRLVVLREAIGIDITFERFVDEVSRLSSQWFPDASFYEFVDPTGKNRVGTDGNTYLKILKGKPLLVKKIVMGANSPVARKKGVIDFLKTNVKGQPCFLTDPSCEYINKGFEGGFLYTYLRGTLREVPEKNIYSHCHDALAYLCSKIMSTNLIPYNPNTNKILEPRFGGRTPPTTPTIEAPAIVSGGMYGK